MLPSLFVAMGALSLLALAGLRVQVMRISAARLCLLVLLLMAGGYLAGCASNGNGFPDACDIAAGISLDEDQDGIPDECQGQNPPSGMTWQQWFAGSGFTGPLDPNYLAAWTALRQWSMQQDWGSNAETTGAEQFQMLVNKL